jgi:hypothetical protein
LKMKKWTLNQFQIGKDIGVGLQIQPSVNLNLKTKRIKLLLEECLDYAPIPIQ